MSWQHALRGAWNQRGWLARAFWPVSGLSRWWVHAAQQRARQNPPQRAAVPVVIVGNVVAGGAGKTPSTLALARDLAARGERPLILSKGHGRQAGGPAHFTVQAQTAAAVAGDEALLMAQQSRCPVVVTRARRAGIAWALQQHPDTSVVLCDDGLQDHDLAADVELVVHDARGVGNGWLMPAGPLREPWPRHPWRVGVTTLHLLATAAHESPPELPDLSEPLWWVQRHLAPQVRRLDDTVTTSLSQWQQQPCQALAAIAKPEQFFAMLQAQGLDLRARHARPDHQALETAFRDLNEAWPLLVTAKDAVKLSSWPLAWQSRTWVLDLQFDLPEGLCLRVAQAVQKAREDLSSSHGKNTA
jgi:tetraacyldisaccharide 4'-kinase